MRPALSTIAFFLAVIAVAGAAAAAPPKLQHLFPAGAGRGETTEVAATGSFSDWPVKVWVNRPGLEAEATDEKGKLRIHVDAEAAAGLYWLRVFDGEGASSPRPFVVGTLPEALEEETNDVPSSPQEVDCPVVVNGKLRKRGDVDGYRIPLKTGETLVASLAANRTLGSPMDAVLQVCDARGFVLAQNDDARGLDPLLIFESPKDGDYLVRTFAFPAEPDSSIRFAGGEDFIYRLTLTTGGFIDHALPLAASSGDSTDVRLFGWNIPSGAASLSIPAHAHHREISAWHPQLAGHWMLPVRDEREIVAEESSALDAPQAIEPPATISGRLESPGDVDAFRFVAVKGRKIACRAESHEIGFPLDAMLQVVDSSGKVVAENDDPSRERRDPALSFSPPADGEFDVRIEDRHGRGGLRFAYRLTIRAEQPDFRLSLSADSFVLAPGKPLEIPVAIERVAGFDGEIELLVEGLPETVRVESAASAPKGETAKAIKLKLSADGGGFSGPCRIVGRSRQDEGITRTATYSLEGLDARGADVWLTVTGDAPSRGAN